MLEIVEIREIREEMGDMVEWEDKKEDTRGKIRRREEDSYSENMQP